MILLVAMNTQEALAVFYFPIFTAYYDTIPTSTECFDNQVIFLANAECRSTLLLPLVTLLPEANCRWIYCVSDSSCRSVYRYYERF